MTAGMAVRGADPVVRTVPGPAPRVLVVCTDYGPPWNEGEKNIARVLERMLPRHGVEVSVCSKIDPDPTLPAYHRPSPRQVLDNLRFWARVGRTARARGATIVHVLTSLSSALGVKSFCIKRWSGARVVLHVTGLARPVRGYPLLLSADRVVVGGAYLQPYFPDAIDLPPVSPHVNPELDRARVPPRTPTGQRVLYLGSMEPGRGVHTVVDAVALLAAGGAFPDLTLTIAWNGDGDPAYERRVRAQVRDLGLSCVGWVGTVADLGCLYRDHDLVVIPPVTQERMGFPLRLIEALSYGRPVVASDAGELPVAADGCGIVFPRADAHALAAAVERMLTDPQLYQTSAEQALERARQYDPAHTVARLAEVYRELVAGDEAMG